MATPLYITPDEVLLYTRGKIVEGTDTNAGEFTTAELETLCRRGEIRAETVLARRYLLPLQSITTGTFIGLPEGTQEFLKDLFIWSTLNILLPLAFGENSSAVGATYYKWAQSQYDTVLKRHMHIDRQNGLYLSPPLEDLAIDGQTYTGQKSSQEIRVQNPIACRDDAKAANDRLPSPTNLSGWYLWPAGQCRGPCDE